MKTRKQWRDIYNTLLKPHNDDILLSLSLQEFMILNEKHKENTEKSDPIPYEFKNKKDE